MSDYEFDWSDLAFGNKKGIKDLTATFIAAPREISQARFKELVKSYLPKGNIVLGIAEEEYILGFESQPQFKALRYQQVEKLIAATNAAKFPYKIYTLRYAQRDLQYLLEKLTFKRVVLINGSWKYMFHSLPAYYAIASKKLDYELVSAFKSEAEAKKYTDTIKLPSPTVKAVCTASEMLILADQASKQSYDYCFQTGAVLGRKHGRGYEYVVSAFNKVEPYQTYAMYHGSVREKNFSPMNDLNHYDTVHAEAMLVIEAQKQQLELEGTTLFINLLPCPNCARMLCETDIAEIVYQEDHSSGFALRILEEGGKKVSRVVQ
jgi:deoxycytidylate deaminase